ncbi:MAG: epoxyqueuosine reductase QueH [Alphaproteobacteria bacterium]|nr:epoxyqueuosine reductase QueH [Alphaproteobacteria bacterium]
MSDKLLVLSCCAPCSVGVIHALRASGRAFAVLFYNPNIRPAAEYRRRLDENKRVCADLGVPFVDLPYEPQHWDAVCGGLTDKPERGRRCALCFKLRLAHAARYAADNGFAAWTSVLGFSRHKDLNQVNRIARAVAAECALPYDFTDWRTLAPETAERTRAKNLYRQNYCGCKPEN